MPETVTVVIHFKDSETHEKLRDSVEKRCQHLAEEFAEVERFELTLSEDGALYAGSGHVTGKGTDIGTHARGKSLGNAADQVLDKLERQLRRHHDKRIFAQRREARREPPKKSQGTG